MAGHGHASMSVRKYIKWGDGIASEPTSTLVLTSPQRQFVDVRILLPVTRSTAITTTIRDPEKLDWAFAGTSNHDADASPPHSVFRHWVDSRYAEAEAVRDEGDMVPSGREGEVIERGEMVNPATGRLEMYEECWVDGLKGGQDGGEGRAGWVLKCDAKNGDARGIMVRIGTTAQGVLRVGNMVAVGRWEIGPDGHGVKVLVPVAEIGELCRGFPAVELLLDPWSLGKTAESRDGERSWSCVECWSDEAD